MFDPVKLENEAKMTDPNEVSAWILVCQDAGELKSLSAACQKQIDALEAKNKAPHAALASVHDHDKNAPVEGVLPVAKKTPGRKPKGTAKTPTPTPTHAPVHPHAAVAPHKATHAHAEAHTTHTGKDANTPPKGTHPSIVPE
jgi:hypothetical protein